MEHPADGVEGIPTREKDNEKDADEMKTVFYLVAVPSYFEKGLSRYHVYQLISNFESTCDRMYTQ